MDIVSDVKTWITTDLPDLYATMKIDSWGDDMEALQIRGDPSSAVVTEFIDGSMTGQQQVTFYARSAYPATALDALQSIYDELNQPEITLTDVLVMRVSPVSIPAFVSKETTGESIYSFTVNIDFDNNTEIGV